jgi:hypothetical protein
MDIRTEGLSGVDNVWVGTFAVSSNRLLIDSRGNIVLGGSGAVSTSATDGFTYIPTCAGTPSGTPSTFSGKSAIIYDTTNNRFYTYNSGWQNLTSVGANPSASIGLTAVNGSAATFMRSDAAPALSQSIAPTWTGNHTWTRNIASLQVPIQLTQSDSSGAIQVGFSCGSTTGYTRLESNGFYAQSLNSGNACTLALRHAGRADIISGTGASHFHVKHTVTDAATELFRVALPTLKSAGGVVKWFIRALDATDAQALSGVTVYSAVNKGGVYTKSVITDAANTASALSAGTLTASFDLLDGTDQVTFRVTPTGSLTETTYEIYWTVEALGPQAITIV